MGKITNATGKINLNEITPEKLAKYFQITEEAFAMASSVEISRKAASMNAERIDFLNMISCYIADARHFEAERDFVNAFAALNYAHGWLDAGARIGLWDVHDNRLFTVD